MDRERFIYKKKLQVRWLMKMAWRDSRRNFSRLALFISSIVLGIAALVAIFSVGDNIQTDIDEQAKTLTGADLIIQSPRQVSDTIRPLLDSLGEKRSRECSFASMVYFKKNNGTRLVQVCALEGEYPYYGDLETTPVYAEKEFRKHQQALVDKTLMLQYNARVGDSIQVGEVTFEIAGILNKEPGRTGFSTAIAPPVYIPYRYLDQTGLLKKGSRFSYNYYYKFDSTVDVEKVVSKIKSKLEKADLNYQTVTSNKKNTGRTFEDLTQFLTLIGFIALLLGCIGVASSIHVYIKEKLNSIAILKCLGANGLQAFLIYMIQVTGIGLIGSVIGIALGIIVQQILPAVFKDFLPIELSTTISWISVGKGLIIGVLISLLFGLLPLISIRKISPLTILRMPVESITKFFDPWRWMVYTIIIVFIATFIQQQVESWPTAISYTAGILVAFLVLTLAAWFLRWLVRMFFPASWNYLWRQGFANLYRPNNQTLILVVTIGLGTALIGVLYFIQGILVNRITLSSSGDQPNMVLFDIQPKQQNDVVNLTKQFQLPVLQQVPIVTLRIESINGKNEEQVKNDTASKIPHWAFQNEFRVTYRDTLTNSEELTEGKLGKPVRSPHDIIKISLEEGNAGWMHVNVGDTIVFNVQGMLVATVVGSLRKVDWQRIQTNFRIIFPTGVLEDAPQFHVLITRVPTPEVSAKFQQAVVQQFPNVSIIDLGLVLSVLNDVLGKIGFVIRFIATFSMITGLIVLIASVLISKYQRIQETVLLRTLGANRKQILSITAIEYFFLGALAATTGIILSLIGSWLLAKFTFNASFTISWQPVIIIFASLSFLTVIIGLINSRSILNKAPLEILRKEV
jgi:putative ABC transport system permease protein